MPDTAIKSTLGKTTPAGFPQAPLFLLASGLLMLMTMALEPGVALPLAAFLAMATLTSLLGQRLSRELAVASTRIN